MSFVARDYVSKMKKKRSQKRYYGPNVKSQKFMQNQPSTLREPYLNSSSKKEEKKPCPVVNFSSLLPLSNIWFVCIFFHWKESDLSIYLFNDFIRPKSLFEKCLIFFQISTFFPLCFVFHFQSFFFIPFRMLVMISTFNFNASPENSKLDTAKME